jgi:hypothetical protein
MRHGDRKIVIARLKAKPLLAGQLVSALAFAVLAVGQAAPVATDGAAAMLRAILFDDAIASAAMLAAAFVFWTCLRLWRQRDAWIFHDGARLYRGGGLSWPLSLIRDVVIDRGELGIASLRLVVDDDSEVTRPLVLLPLLEDSPEAVRGGVLFAAAGMRGVPGGVTVN